MTGRLDCMMMGERHLSYSNVSNTLQPRPRRTDHEPPAMSPIRVQWRIQPHAGQRSPLPSIAVCVSLAAVMLVAPSPWILPNEAMESSEDGVLGRSGASALCVVADQARLQVYLGAANARAISHVTTARRSSKSVSRNIR
jgi:hypothetical protein